MLPQTPQPLGDQGEHVLPAHHGNFRHPRQRRQHCGQDAPHQGHQQLGPDQLAAAYRQGEHQISLVGHQVLIEPVYHQHQGQQQHTEGGHAEQGGKHRLDDGQHRALGIPAQQAAEQGAAPAGHQQQGIHRQHDPPGGPEFMTKQLTQHSGTPPGTARPRCSPSPGGSDPPTAAAECGPC